MLLPLSGLACFTGLTSVPEGMTDIEAPRYYENDSVSRLSFMESEFQELMADRTLSLDRFIDYALGFLNQCDEVLQEFTSGIDIGEPVRR
jgi:hypothetical protein